MGMKITIVTVCRNSASTIKSTVESVLSQDYADIEYIVVDGGSTDGTLGILQDYAGKLDRLISEPDKGIYDAINKGIAAATGEIVGILNSDDFYESPTVLSSVVRAFTDSPRADIVFGDVVYVRPDSLQRVVRYYGSGAFRPWKLRFGWEPPHPATFVRRSAYARIGPYATDFRVASDYEMFVKAFLVHHMTFARVDAVLVRMRTGGISTSGFRINLMQNREIVQACRRNGIYTNLLLVLAKAPFKLLEFFIIPATLR